MAGEQAARVPVGPATEEDQVESGEFDGVLCGEDAHERLLVLVRQLLHVVEVLRFNGVDSRLAERGGDLCEQFVVEELVV